MSDDFAGAGGPPPKKEGGKRFANDPEYALYEKIQSKEGDKEFDKRVKLFSVNKGVSNIPVVMLDPLGQRRSVLMHNFKGRDGKWGNLLACIKQDEPRGCAMCEALGKEGRWHWALTCIDRRTWSPTEGKNKGVVYTNFRRLVFVTEQGYEDMKSIELKDPQGWRGRKFDVSRNNDKTGYRIGTSWYPDGKMSEEDLVREFEEAAANYGLPVETFTTALGYDDLFAAPSYEQMCKIAAEYKGVDSDDGGGEGVSVASGDEEAIAF